MERWLLGSTGGGGGGNTTGDFSVRELLPRGGPTISNWDMWVEGLDCGVPERGGPGGGMKGGPPPLSEYAKSLERIEEG